MSEVGYTPACKFSIDCLCATSQNIGWVETLDKGVGMRPMKVLADTDGSFWMGGKTLRCVRCRLAITELSAEVENHSLTPAQSPSFLPRCISLTSEWQCRISRSKLHSGIRSKILDRCRKSLETEKQGIIVLKVWYTL